MNELYASYAAKCLTTIMTKSARPIPVPWAPFIAVSSEAVSAAAAAIERVVQRGGETLYDHYLTVRSSHMRLATH
jgi:hypothetical protein